jgi:hypothetical protein
VFFSVPSVPLWHLLCLSGSRCLREFAKLRSGEVTERFKVLASKASVRGTVPGVRIPPSPPSRPHFSAVLRAASGEAHGKQRYNPIEMDCRESAFFRLEPILQRILRDESPQSGFATSQLGAPRFWSADLEGPFPESQTVPEVPLRKNDRPTCGHGFYLRSTR